ncbi:uncharacterized protein K489DRAFT_412848 [Dissoconium aciculare CBS 342.82]|uniref:Uncharacterized protein n=1 Tax=Dissoconium aciculare CBS 342.82 TaxID=1314786 RepID=A0A6J3LW94_9PEZI|nr:uncharacterized protein K489DRAFT_412848 [Dissoconium aciculare CBS 342.82]KAF1819539.1 hypothetical protein K489DRAFT_412848 [Dissoconium aciculare CBS 342.82]
MTSGSSAQDLVSPVGTTRPAFVISSAAINAIPVELDSTPASVDQVRAARRGSKAMALDAIEADKIAKSTEVENRERLISERKDNPAVLVDIPQTPRPEELEQSGALADN